MLCCDGHVLDTPCYELHECMIAFSRWLVVFSVVTLLFELQVCGIDDLLSI